jgi:integrase
MRRVKLYLPYAAWPVEDRTRWEVAFQVGTELFEDSGPAAHLAERTWQPKSCGGVTIAIYLYHLWFTLRYICPSEDWSWLLTISKRIAAQAKPKPEKHHLVTSETLYALGIELMDYGNGNAAKNISMTHALAYRDGLIIALLALIPLRRRTLAALRIGKHLVQSGDLWALDIPAEDTKTKRPLEFPISAELSGRIDLYLKQFRCRIPRAETHDGVWASSRANVRGAKDLLGHASFDTTEKYYIMAQSRIAGHALARAIGNTGKG